jgi:chromate reductase
VSLAPSSQKVLAFAGSCRQGSFNHALLQHVIALAAESQPELTFTLISLADYPLPLFNEDVEASDPTPPAIIALKALFAQHDGLLIASPEYNSLPTPLLLNTFSWLSRQAAGEAPYAAFKGKVAALVAASPGGLGGLRALPVVRHGLQNMGVTVVPQVVSVASAQSVLAAPALADPTRGMILTQLAQLSHHLR